MRTWYIFYKSYLFLTTGRLFLGRGSTVQLDANACPKNANGMRCQVNWEKNFYALTGLGMNILSGIGSCHIQWSGTKVLTQPFCREMQICHDLMAEETEMEEAYASQSRIKRAKSKRKSIKKSDSKRLKKKQKEAVSELICFSSNHWSVFWGRR